MSRLTAEALQALNNKELALYDHDLRQKINTDLIGLTALACGIDETRLVEKIAGMRIAVVPNAFEQGCINGFVDAVAMVAGRMGASPFVTIGHGVDGIYEAVYMGARFLLTADSGRFIALDLKTGNIADHGMATALGYVAVLECLADGLTGKSVLLLGFGDVGAHALGFLRKRGATVIVFDKSESCRREAVRRSAPVLRFEEIACIKEFNYILDATDEGDWLTEDLLADGVKISAPGLPCSLNAELLASIGANVVHDPIQIGTAVMIGLLAG
jgi:pyrrolysine biosynthesis protein PylD